MEQKSGKRTKGNVDSIDIIEVCSQPRVTLAAEKIGGVRPGASLHITTQDEDGSGISVSSRCATGQFGRSWMKSHWYW